MIFLKGNMSTDISINIDNGDVEYEICLHYLANGYALGEIVDGVKNVGNYVLISYPKYDDLTPVDIRRLVNFCGEEKTKNGICVEQICILFGEINEILE